MEKMGITRVTDDLYYWWVPPHLTAHPDDPNPWFWHWCAPYSRWVVQSTSEHTLVSRDPLHMEPSLLWNCCGMHGWVHTGIWRPA